MDRSSAIISGSGQNWKVQTATGTMTGYSSAYWAARACEEMGLIWSIYED